MPGYGARMTFSGLTFSIELRCDGTGVIRRRSNGQPLAAVTSAMSSRIERRIASMIDDLAVLAILKPATWNPEE